MDSSVLAPALERLLHTGQAIQQVLAKPASGATPKKKQTAQPSEGISNLQSTTASLLVRTTQASGQRTPLADELLAATATDAVAVRLAVAEKAAAAAQTACAIAASALASPLVARSGNGQANATEFRNLYLDLLADAVPAELDVLRTDETLDADKIALLVKQMEQGADVFSPLQQELVIRCFARSPATLRPSSCFAVRCVHTQLPERSCAKSSSSSTRLKLLTIKQRRLPNSWRGSRKRPRHGLQRSIHHDWIER
eukprot:TRINITY_DN6990_c0_g1_i1.p1 TRINITY_DN6990_c0_g1~~TRINITY_DN6990_c0_g1_i1.p1  ORF type:complete len:255 (+),score=41.85 TRINITY_DN6990_c0_g1_i1:13-777(+)